MSRQPSKSSDHEGQVRKRAHAIWEREGRPHGKEKEHWERALEELGAEAERDRSTDPEKKKQSTSSGASGAKQKRPSSR